MAWVYTKPGEVLNKLKELIYRETDSRDRA